MEELTEREKIVTQILEIAYKDSNGFFLPEKDRLLHGRPMAECNKITEELGRFGQILGSTPLGTWGAFKINKDGISFIESGGYAARKKKEKHTEDMEELKAENLRLQNAKLVYDKKTRIIAWLSLIISAISVLSRIFF